MRTWIVVGLLSSSAIARAGGALRGDVLVWNDAELYADPSDDAPTMRFAKLDRVEAAVGHAVPMHMIGRHGDFIEVERAGDGQCTGATLDHPLVDHLHVFIKEDALAPVIVKPWSARFDDGSRIALRVGEPVLPIDDGVVAFPTDEGVLHADVPAASIGRSYAPIVPAKDPAEPRFELRSGAQGAIGGQTYTVGKSLITRGAAKIDHPSKDHSRFRIQLRCAELDVVVPDDAVEPYGMTGLATDGAVGGFGRAQVGDRYLIPKGTPLSTPAGRRAGVAADDIDIDPPRETACFDASVTLTRPWAAASAVEEPIENEAIRLCAPIERLKIVPQRNNGELHP